MKKQLLLLAICFLTCTYSVYAQKTNNYFTGNYNTANPYKAIEAGKISSEKRSEVDYYTGLLNIKIPLWTYKDPDFEIPIAIQYTSNGFVPSQESTPVGHNWALQAGGFITRSINGIPDDLEMFHGDMDVLNPEDALGMKSIIFMKGGYLDACRRGGLGRSRELITTYDDSQCDYKYEKEPDIFSFSFGNHSGKFIIKDGNEGILLSGDLQYKIHVNQLACYNPSKKGFDKHMSKITIVSPDGYKYEFGGTQSYYDVVNTNTIGASSEASEMKFHISKWHLAKITAPNNRTVTFKYEQTDRNVKVKGKYHMYHYDQRITYYYQTNSASDLITPSNNWNDTESRLFSNNDKQCRCLNSIIVDNTPTVLFYYREVDNIIGKLVSSIYFLENTWPHSNLSYRIKDKYAFLENITTSRSENYNFTYNIESTTLPEKDTYMTDHWGYWNNYNYGGSNVKEYIKQLSRNKTFNTDLSTVGMLTKLTYPTGGWEEFAYEPNTYSFGHRANGGFVFPVDYKKKNIGGGARLRSVASFDGTKISNKRIFEYNNNNLTSGVIGIEPKYEFHEKFSWLEPHSGQNVTKKERVVEDRSISSRSINMDNLIGEHPIGYSDVYEKFEDGSYIHYQFSTWKDYPDERGGDFKKEGHDDYYYNQRYQLYRSDSMNHEVAWKLGLFRLSSNAHKRGCLTHKTLHRSNSKIAEQTKYTYTGSSSAKNINCVASNRFGEIKYAIRLDVMLLAKEEKTIFPDPNSSTSLKIVTNYKYNSYNQNIEIKEENAEESKTQYIDYMTNYATNRLPPSLEKCYDLHMIDRPIGVYTFRNTKLIEADRYEFETVNNIPLLFATYKYTYSDESNIPVEITPLINQKEYRKLQVINRYNSRLCPVEILDCQTGIHTVLIWGYKGLYPIAEIQNASLNEVDQALGVGTQDKWINTAPTAADFDQLVSLRARLPKALVSVYQYKPYVGISSHTDPSGRKTLYEYDSAGRLIVSKDEQNNRLKSYKYHYKTPL